MRRWVRTSGTFFFVTWSIPRLGNLRGGGVRREREEGEEREGERRGRGEERERRGGKGKMRG